MILYFNRVHDYSRDCSLPYGPMAGVALWPFFFYVASYVVPQICHDIYATGVLEVARVGNK